MNPIDYVSITKNQQATWASGDFAVIALAIVPAAEELVHSADPHAGARVLDVACGSGSVAHAAARRYCEVTGVDYVPALLERARRRAEADGTTIRFVEGDAQALPFEDASFDFVFSTFGVMFAPDQEKAAAELVRVTKKGGTIAIANWTPEGSVGKFFRTVTRHSPPPPELPPPSRWGSEQGLRELLADRTKLVRATRKTVTEYFLSVEHCVDVFRRFFGPTVRAFAALDADGQRALAADLTTLIREENRATDGTLAMPLEYLEALLSVN